MCLAPSVRALSSRPCLSWAHPSLPQGPLRWAPSRPSRPTCSTQHFVTTLSALAPTTTVRSCGPSLRRRVGAKLRLARRASRCRTAFLACVPKSRRRRPFVLVPSCTHPAQLNFVQTTGCARSPSGCSSQMQRHSLRRAEARFAARQHHLLASSPTVPRTVAMAGCGWPWCLRHSASSRLDRTNTLSCR